METSRSSLAPRSRRNGSGGPSRLDFGVRLFREGEAPAEPFSRVDASPGSRLSRSFALPASLTQPLFQALTRHESLNSGTAIDDDTALPTIKLSGSDPESLIDEGLISPGE